MTHPLLDRTIDGILSLHPETLAVFTGNGFALFADDELRTSFGSAIRLRTLLKTNGTNPDMFCHRLDEAIAAAAPSAQPSSDNQRGLNLFALLPCPLKVPLEEAFRGFLNGLPLERRAGLHVCIEGNANNQLDYSDYIEQFDSLDDMPDIIVTPGFNAFFYQRFVERFIKPGLFASVNEFAGDLQLAALGLTDPEGHYSMLAMNLLVPVVNLTRLAGRPVPRRWADLLEPEFARSIAIRGNRDGTFCETLLMTIRKQFGTDGLARLGKNVRYGWHPSQMVKAIASNRDDAPAVSVMPLFFANTIARRENVTVVWPDDGALVSPVTMLVKREKRAELADLLGFLTGPEVARICAGAFFPALHPAVDNRLPPAAGFTWIGWEYVKGNDLQALIAEANDAFQSGFSGERG